MSKTVRVRYEKGVLRLLEPVDLREGEELIVLIRRRRVSEVLKKYIWYIWQGRGGGTKNV